VESVFETQECGFESQECGSLALEGGSHQNCTVVTLDGP
jgi:hypothetical protein